MPNNSPEAGCERYQVRIPGMAPIHVEMGQRVILGRGHEGGAMLPRAVSREHAVLELTPDGLRVTDLGSTNGTRVDGLPVLSTILHEGSRLRLGLDTVVEVSRAPTVEMDRPVEKPAPGEQPALSHYEIELPLIGTVHLRVGESVVIGRDGVGGGGLPHTVSRKHARLEATPTGLWVEDLESTNGTFVGGMPVTGGWAQDGDTIAFGNVLARVSARPEGARIAQNVALKGLRERMASAIIAPSAPEVEAAPRKRHVAQPPSRR
jgi:pSer/pThr/pTyr-binding forkhead associated (FHA) protein